MITGAYFSVMQWRLRESFSLSERSLALYRPNEHADLKLRAARDLTALLAERGERDQGLDLLAPVFAFFNKGFATPDLLESKALLEALGWTGASAPT